MEKYLKKSNIRAFFFIAVIGTLLHFTYEWTGKNLLVGLFSAVNESTWEHMKLLFMPAFFYFLFESKKYGQDCENLLISRTCGLLAGLLFIPVAFYTYTGIIGRSFLAADIAIFYFSVFLTLYISSHMRNRHFRPTSLAALLLLIAVFLVFAIFTFFPPHIDLFLDPVTVRYG